MKTKAFLTRVIPLLANVKNAGVFNNAVATMTPPLIAELRSAAAEDRIVVAGLETALRSLAAATAFEPQQDAIAQSHAEAEALNDALHAGNPIHADVVLSTSDELLSRIIVNARPLRDVFAIQRDKTRTVRTAAAELSSIIDAEIAAGTRDMSEAAIAARLYDGADGLEDDDYRDRAASLDAVLACAGKLAKAA